MYIGDNTSKIYNAIEKAEHYVIPQAQGLLISFTPSRFYTCTEVLNSLQGWKPHCAAGSPHLSALKPPRIQLPELWQLLLIAAQTHTEPSLIPRATPGVKDLQHHFLFDAEPTISIILKGFAMQLWKNAQ